MSLIFCDNLENREIVVEEEKEKEKGKEKEKER